MTFLRFKFNQARNWLASWDVVSVLLFGGILLCAALAIVYWGAMLWLVISAAKFLASMC
jgi:fatty acid desaturase